MTKDLKVDLKKFTEKKISDPTLYNALELGGKMLSGFNENLELCAQRGKKERKGDFFIVVLRKRETVVDTIVRSLFIHRKTCPTPNYDQIVYQYIAKDDRLKEIWVIPDRESCHILKQNALQVDKSERDLLKFVLDFDDGTLFKIMSKLNGEKKYSLELEENKIKELKEEQK